MGITEKRKNNPLSENYFPPEKKVEGVEYIHYKYIATYCNIYILTFKLKYMYFSIFPPLFGENQIKKYELYFSNILFFILFFFIFFI